MCHGKDAGGKGVHFEHRLYPWEACLIAASVPGCCPFLTLSRVARRVLAPCTLHQRTIAFGLRACFDDDHGYPKRGTARFGGDAQRVQSDRVALARRGAP